MYQNAGPPIPPTGFVGLRQPKCWPAGAILYKKTLIGLFSCQVPSLVPRSVRRVQSLQ